MINEDEIWLHKRLIVGLGSGTNPESLIKIIDRITAAIRTDITGLFIEDEEILSYAELPFARILDSKNLNTKPLDKASMVKLLQEHSRVCSRRLAHLAKTREVSFEFAKVAGKPLTQIQQLVTQTDMVVSEAEGFGRQLRDFVREFKTSTFKARGIVLYPQNLQTSFGPVIAIDDGDEAGRQTIKLAEKLAQAENTELILFLLRKNISDAKQIKLRAQDLVSPQTNLRIHAIERDDLEQLINELKHFHPSIIVGDIEGQPFVDTETTSKIIESVRVPIILLR